MSVISYTSVTCVPGHSLPIVGRLANGLLGGRHVDNKLNDIKSPLGAAPFIENVPRYGAGMGIAIQMLAQP